MTFKNVTPQYLLEESTINGALTYYTNSAYVLTSITLNRSSLSLNSGGTFLLQATTAPLTAPNQGVTWASNDESVATINENGWVTAVAGGTCTITCTAKDGGGASATCEVTVMQLVTSIVLSETNISLPMDGYKKLTATVLPSNASNKNVTWSSSDESIAIVDHTGKVTAIAEGTCTITVSATDGSGVSATCTVNVNIHEYVDLGLPSGTLWATCNIGADNPEDYGLYFAWGETTGYTQDTTDGHSFNWASYKYAIDDYNTLTKYCNDSYYGYNGFTDTLTELEPGDDAATVNWGSDWCMPSHAQFVELLDECTWRWRYSGQRGFEVVGPNGNILFLPAAGSRSGTSLQEADDWGYYWSRSLKSGYPSYAYDLYFYSASWSWSYDYRATGQSVRPVRASQ
jgi:hypothetical protein